MKLKQKTCSRPPQNHKTKKEGVARGTYFDTFTISIIDSFIFYTLANLLRSCHCSHKESRRESTVKRSTLFIETSLLLVFQNSSLSLSPFTASRVSPYPLFYSKAFHPAFHCSVLLRSVLFTVISFSFSNTSLSL